MMILLMMLNLKLFFLSDNPYLCFETCYICQLNINTNYYQFHLLRSLHSLYNLCSYQLCPQPPTAQAIAEIQRGLNPPIYRILCPCRPGTYPGLEIYPGISAYAWFKGARGYGAGTYLGIYMNNVPHSPGEYLGCVAWMLQSTKLNPWASPHYPCVVGGGRVTIDSRIKQ